MASITAVGSSHAFQSTEPKEHHSPDNNDRKSSQSEPAYDQPSIKEVLTIQYENVDEIFNIWPDVVTKIAWFLHWRSSTPVPKHLVPALRAFDPEDGSKGLMDARVRMVLLTILAGRKRSGHLQYYRGIRMLPSSAYELLKLEVDKRVELSWTYKRKPVRFVGTIRYCLRLPDELHPLFIIDVQGYDKLDRDHTLAYLDMIHYARRETGLPGRTIFGLTTNSYEWYFIRVNKDATYSTKLLSGYLSQWQEIVSAIGAMIDHAAGFQSGIVRGPLDLKFDQTILTPPLLPIQ